MSRHACADPVPLAELIAYERGELSGAAQDQVEEHMFVCAACAERLASVEAIARGIAALVASGAVSTGATAAAVRAAADRGVEVRSYRLAPGDVVPCTCAPSDAYVAVRFDVDLAPGEHADLEVATTILASGDVIDRRQEDVAVDYDAGAITLLYAGDTIRAAPRSRWEMHVRVRGDAGERVLGPYTLDHTPWEQLPAG